MCHLDHFWEERLSQLLLPLLPLCAGLVDEQPPPVRGRHHLGHAVAEDGVRHPVDVARARRDLELEPRELDVPVHAEPEGDVTARAAVHNLHEGREIERTKYIGYSRVNSFFSTSISVNFKGDQILEF